MPYFHFCLSCRERLYSTSRMTIDHRCQQCGGRLMPYHLVRAPGPARRRRGRSYPSLADFYNGDPRRLASPERDVGLYWRDGAGEPLHRAAWVEDTGELYIVRAENGEEGGGSGGRRGDRRAARRRLAEPRRAERAAGRLRGPRRPPRARAPADAVVTAPGPGCLGRARLAVRHPRRRRALARGTARALGRHL